MTHFRPIFWRQGSFLEPQHFQLLEIQRREELSFILASLHPWPWGLSSLRLNEDALANFTLEILNLDLFLPWGAHLIFPYNLQIPTRSFRKAWQNPDEILTVYLAIPDFSLTNANVAGSSFVPGESELKTDVLSRLYTPLSDPELIPDFLAGGPPGRVETLIHNGSLLFGEEAQSASGKLVPIAKLLREGERVTKAQFAPPTLRLFSGNSLFELVSEVLELLRAKGRQLEEFKITSAQSRLEALTANSLALITALGIVSRYVARLYFLLSATAVHPYAAFCTLRELIAELSIFNTSISALGESTGDPNVKSLSLYVHEDPYPAFLESRNLIARLLDGISPGPELSLTFSQSGQSYTLTLPEWLDKSYICWLSVQSNLPQEQMSANLSMYCKLSSPERINHLVSYNLPGVALRALREVPVGLPRVKGVTYFAIRQKDPLWEEALASKRLSLFWDQATPDTKVMLLGNRL
ncbi:MAG: type VI secretion system baseplate subunit TssK [Deltaproteobacteria bacterium]|jgi:type VI secretion system protein ImpJ|nr:type VI secretion system baseplate subunit TssK [Deltaproteobacteria bacterium]